MFRPAKDLIVIDPIKDLKNIVMPDNHQPASGDLYLVKAVGRGFFLDSGQLIPCESEVGDVVAVAGKILRVPTKEGDVLIARDADVIAIDNDYYDNSVSTNLN